METAHYYKMLHQSILCQHIYEDAPWLGIRCKKCGYLKNQNAFAIKLK